MKKKIALNRKSQRGFALMTVFILTTVLLIMVLSLISLTSQTLYRATADVERASIVPLAESAVNEARIMLMNDSTWGKANETLFMCSGGQDVTRARLEPAQSPSISNNNFSFGQKGCYYITFNKNDPKFASGSTVYYSVNNLQGTTAADNWRGTGKVPSHSASIVVTVAVGNTVKHLEVILGPSNSLGGIENGSRGSMNLQTSGISLRKTGTSQAPNIHSNYNVSSKASVILDDISSRTIVVDNPIGATISGRYAIDTRSNKFVDPNGKTVASSWLQQNKGEKTVPDFKLETMIDDIDFETITIPSGIYKVNFSTKKLDYWPDGGDKTTTATISFSPGNEIVPGLKFTYETETVTTTYRDRWGKWQTRTTSYDIPRLLISKDLAVSFDPNNPTTPGTTGNLQIEEASLDFVETDKTLYLPGASTETPDGSGNYKNGNLTLTVWGTTEAQEAGWGQDLVNGEGNICSMGGMNLYGARIYVGSGSETKAFYARGDVDMQTIDQVKLNGLVFTNGNFTATVGFSDDDINNPKCAVCHADGAELSGKCTRGKTRTNDTNKSLNRTLEIDGAIIVAGDPNSVDPNSGTMKIKALDQFNLTFNDNVLKKMTSSSGGYTRILSWHEF